MAKKKQLPEKSCGECIHEFACLMWCFGGALSPENAPKCPNYTTVRDSAAYLIGYMEGKKQQETTVK